MFCYVYSKDYGWNPLKFLLKGKNFYKERNRWASGEIMLSARSPESI